MRYLILLLCLSGCASAPMPLRACTEEDLQPCTHERDCACIICRDYPYEEE